MNPWEEREAPVRIFIDQLRNVEAENEMPRFNRSYPEMTFFRALNEALRTQHHRGDIKWLQADWGRGYIEWLANDSLENSVEKMVKLKEKFPVAEIVLRAAEAIAADVHEFRESEGLLTKYDAARFNDIVREVLGVTES